MSNQISTFNFNSNPVRVELIQNEPFFCLSDVCDILGLNRRSTEAFRLNEKGCNNITTLTKGGKQELTFINEPNLYRIIFKSRKTEAVEFQNWVFEEVLPQIRKTGQYSQNQQQTLPLAPQPERTFTRTFNEQFVFQLGWLWYGHGRMGDLLGKLEPALRAIGSHYAPTVHSHSIEYRRQYQILKPFIAELLADYDIDTFNRHGLNAVLKALDKGTRPQLTRN